MAQLLTDGIRDVQMTRASENGSINTPPEEDFNTQAMRGSMQQLLSENLGTFVVIEFLIGTQNMERKEGILYSVGRSVVVLYEEISQTFVMCDIFSVKFVTFYLPGQRPGRSGPGYAMGGAVLPAGIPMPAGVALPGMGMSGMGMPAQGMGCMGANCVYPASLNR